MPSVVVPTSSIRTINIMLLASQIGAQLVFDTYDSSPEQRFHILVVKGRALLRLMGSPATRNPVRGH